MVTRRRSFAQARKAAGYTQESLAEALGVDRTTVARWEAGGAEPQPWQRPKIAETFGLSLDKLAHLLSDAGTAGHIVEVTDPQVDELATPADVRVLLDELKVMVSASDATWEEFGIWLTRRSLLKYCASATALPVLGVDRGAATRPLKLAALPVAPWAGPIYETVLHPTNAMSCVAVESEAADNRIDLAQLHRAAEKVVYASLLSDYAQLGRFLPELIGSVELAALTARGADQARTQRLLSDVYAVAGWTLIKADSPAAAWIAAQRAVKTAEEADDVPRQAAATRCLAEVYMRARNFEEASRTAFLAATYLDTAHADKRTTILCLRGAALLSVAAAAARRGDSREASTALKAAAGCASELGEERTDLGTFFGPTNVAIHQVAVAVELGNASEAMRHIPKVNLDRMPRQLTERRSRFLIDVARAHAALGDDSAALDALLQSDQIAPDELRYHRLTHELLRNLLTRERRSSKLRALADRCRVLN